MRTCSSVVALVSFALLAGCSSSSSSPILPGSDAEAGDSGSHVEAGSTHDATSTHDAPLESTVSEGGAPSDAEAGPPGIRCAKLLGCDQACMSTSCTDACYAEATGTAQGIFNAFNACISATCLSGPGDVCADAGASACGTCQEGAATGPCVALLLKCESDKGMGPSDPDGGSAFYDAGAPKEAGKDLNCGSVVSCEGACGDAGASCESSCASEGTATAQALANQLEHCLATACPAVDGGSCATPGSGCTGCRTQAEFDPSVCGTPFSTCQSDTSNSSDAGTTPVALQGGTLSTLVTGLDQPQVVLVQGGYVYYSQVTATAPVSRVSLDGGAPSNLSASQPYPMGLAVDSSNIYAWNSGSFSGSTTVNDKNGSVVQLPLSGGAPVTLATGIEAAYAAPYLNAVAVSGGQVYWVAGASGSDGVIMTTPSGSAAAPKAVYQNQPFPEALATDGVNLYWANWGTFGASGAYNNDGTVLQGAIAGGAVTTLASGLSAPAAIAIDSKNVYFTNAGQLGGDNLPAPGTGSVLQVAIGGGTVVTLAKAQAIPLGITVGGSTVYYNEYTLSAPGQIISVPVGGGTLTPVAAGLADPFGITVSGSTLYWSDSPPTAAGSGKILSLTLL